MTWGTFSITHIISLIAGCLLIIGLYFILKNKSEKIKVNVLFLLSLTGVAAILYNLIKWNSPLEYLPLHLCSLNAIILPIAIKTKSKILNNLLLLWSLGAIFALVVNHEQSNYDIFSWTFALYYFPHVFYLGIPILAFQLNLVKKDCKCIVSTIIITFIAYTAIHFVNLLINRIAITNHIVDWRGQVISVNYMFSITPTNPLLKFFWKILPYRYWYILLVLPLVVLYLFILYFKQITIDFQSKPSKRREYKNQKE